MADIKLGVSGSEVTLAHTITEPLPTCIGKRINRAEMSDGTIRWAFYAQQRSWSLTWVKLTAAQLASLITLRGYNQTLRYQNNDESATWYTVVITDFRYDVINPVGTPVFYGASMTIEEAV